MVAATLPVPIDSLVFFYTEINIVGVDVLYALFGGRIDPCGWIYYPGILPDVHFLFLNAEYEDIVHTHIIVRIETTGVCRKIVDVGVKQASAEVGYRAVLKVTECPVQRSAKPDFFQSFPRDRLGSNIHHPKSVA